MTRRIGSRTAGGEGPGGGTLQTAAEVPSDGPSNVQLDLNTLFAAVAQVSGLIVIDSVAKLEAEFPLGLITPGAHTINKQTLWVSQTGAPFDLTATGAAVEIVNPGTMFGLGGLKVLTLGNVAGPLLFGEPVIENMAARNVNASGSDAAFESLSGRFISLVNVALLGQTAGTVSNATGLCLMEKVQLAPSAPGATGLVIDGVNGVILADRVAAQSPGGAAYTALSLAPTCVIAADVRFTGCAIFGLPGDVLLDIDAAATLPGSPLPTTVIGCEIFACTVKGGSDLFALGGLDQTDIRVLSSSNTSGPTSQFIASARYESIGAPPDAILDHVGQPGVALPVPYDNSQAGGVGGTLRTLTITSANARHTLLLGTVDAATVNAGGTYTGGDGDYPATQAATSGSGSGAEFTVTLTSGAITAVVSIDTLGEGYEPADTITLSVVGPAETVAAVLDVDDVAWALRTDGPLNELAGSAAWTVDFERGAGGAGSTVFGFVQRRVAGAGLWVELDGTRSVPTALLASPQRVGSRVPLADIGSGDEWRVVWVNDNGNSTQTAFTIIEPTIEARL